MSHRPPHDSTLEGWPADPEREELAQFAARVQAARPELDEAAMGRIRQRFYGELGRSAQAAETAQPDNQSGFLAWPQHGALVDSEEGEPSKGTLPYPAAHSEGTGNDSMSANYPNQPGQPVRPGQPVPAARPVQPGRPVPVGGARPIPVKPGAQPTKMRDRQEEGEEEGEEVVENALKKAPPWLVSAIVHALIIIVLGLWFIYYNDENAIVLDGDWAEVEGEQLEDDSFTVETDQPESLEDVVLTEMKPVEDPFAAPAKLEVTPLETGTMAISDINAPAIGMALNGRQEGMKQALLRKYGGSPGSEKAVMMALEWLARQQDKNRGSWSLKGPYPGGSSQENTVAATAMAVLAFQGAGHTHKSGKFKTNVQKGWEYLLKEQNADGDFYNGEGPWNHHIYSHGQAAIAICELYGMTKDAKYREPAVKATQFCVNSQHRLGGWRYSPKGDSDTSVTGWVLMALQSARMAGLDVPAGTLEQAGRYLDKASSQGGAQYGYQASTSSTPTMTAEGLLCRQYLGWKQNDERMNRGADYLLAAHLPSWSDRNVYYWYYATQMFHHLEGDRWKKWNGVMRDLLVQKQVKSGGNAGSWDPQGDKWGEEAGRLYTTCLSVFILEVYYRHLPLYANFKL